MRASLELPKLKQIYRRVAARYDFQHGLLTAWSDQHGRRLIVNYAVNPGDVVLDCGGGTGSTGLLAARLTGRSGKVLVFDLSESMLTVARRKAQAAGLLDRMSFCAGDMVNLPFPDDTFDAVLSSYSLCPLYDPARGALEMLRVVKPGGRIGIAHSTEPPHAVTRYLANAVESVVWRIPSLSLGCRAVDVEPALSAAGAKILIRRIIGVPLWPFLILVAEKPVAVK